MKNRGERRGRWSEGGLVAAALLFVLAVSLVIHMNRVPPVETYQPIHDISYDELRSVEMVNINADPVEKLSRLPGVGEVLAQRIVDYREEHGPFDSVEELLRVEGFGEGRLEGIRSEIYLD